MAKPTIVVADDEHHIVELIKLILSDSFTVHCAEDGEEALAAIRKHKPVLVLLDVMMPKLNGYEVCERIREDPALKRTKVAMLSAKAQERDIMQAAKLGADDYITKPFDPIKLEKKVLEMLG